MYLMLKRSRLTVAWWFLVKIAFSRVLNQAAGRNRPYIVSQIFAGQMNPM